MWLKKASTILFLFIYLLSGMPAQQLAKLPVVFQHYQEHKAEDNNITILHFLAIHYLHGSPKDKDYERDMQLPFKSCGDGVASIAIAFVSGIVSVTIARPVEIAEKKNYVVLDQFVHSSYLASIWQPPKNC